MQQGDRDREKIYLKAKLRGATSSRIISVMEGVFMDIRNLGVFFVIMNKLISSPRHARTELSSTSSNHQ